MNLIKIEISRLKSTLLGALIVLTCINSFSQLRISGVVLNENDNSPIPYVAIGMLNTSVGTISELDGSFQLTVPQKLASQDLLFSALGFERLTLKVDSNSFTTRIVIVLKEKPVLLQELTVESKNKSKRFEFGNREFDGGSMYAHTEVSGSAMVILVDNKFPHYSGFKFPAYLDKVLLRIVNNTFKEFKLRLRLYAVDSITGKPGKDLLDKNIIIEERLRNGWVALELADHNIMVSEPVFVGFEWILDAKDRQFLHRQYNAWYQKHPQTVSQESVKIGSNSVSYSNYNGTLWAGTSFGSSATSKDATKFKCYYRFNSFGEWFISPAALCVKISMEM
ncbi:MAG TPA: carboxypeptidase-like regulatory domain-containing protein [Chryseolinea sp.]|nr:carboxypeptidase-like regulatory domain-containing protein [Chryseolinea sp.]